MNSTAAKLKKGCYKGSERTEKAVMDLTDRHNMRIDDAPPAGADKTFLGGFATSARSAMFFGAVVAAGVAFAVMFMYVDAKSNSAHEMFEQARTADELVNTIDRGTSDLQSTQRQFLLTKDPEVSDVFVTALAQTSLALDELLALEAAAPVHQQVSTIRDGLGEFDQKFQTFVAAEREIGLATNTGISAQLTRTSDALKQAFEATGNGNLVNQISRIDQQGEETLLSGSKVGVEEIQKRYRALTAFITNSTLIGDANRSNA